MTDKTKLLDAWKFNLKKKNCKLHDLKEVGIISRQNGKQFLVGLYDATIKKKNSVKINRYVTVVKPSVIIVPLLYYGKQVYTMLVSQVRIYNGDNIVEFPAGSIDFNQKPIDAAINEIKEELHINLNKKSLKKAHKKPIMIEPSCTTSLSYFFYFKMRIDKNFFKKYHLKKTGFKEFGELIKVKIQKINTVHQHDSASIHVGLNLIKNII